MSAVQVDEMRSMPRSRLLNAYYSEAKYAFLRFARSPAFAIPTLAFPLFFYFLVGFVFGAFKAQSAEFDISTYMFCGFATMAAMTPGMFGFGVGFAMEREQGLFTLKRALPMPPMASLFGSVAMSMLSTLIAVSILAVAAFSFGFVHLSPVQLLSVALVVAVGAIPFSALGLLLGSLTTGRAAPAVVNILYILLLYFSGLFVQLPKSIASVVKVSPAFYLHQLSISAAGAKSLMVGGVMTHIAILAGLTMVCLVLATRRIVKSG